MLAFVASAGLRQRARPGNPEQMMRVTFLGAAGTVTGSRFLVELGERATLIDCGLFQGTKRNRLKNWKPFPVEVSRLESVLLTHAHIDHIGYLPALVKAGYSGPVYCTKATADLAAVALPDAGHLQEEEARWANKKGYSKHRPAQPLFTEADARAVLPLLQPVQYGDHFRPLPGLRGKYRDTGHILGAGFIDLKADGKRDGRKIVFSGDVGRPTDAILRPPAQAYNVDYLVMESTYGDRLHGDADPVAELVRVVNESVARGGVLVIPSFAVGRSQTLLYVLRELEEAGRIPSLPVYLDSPMAQAALQVHRKHIADLNLTCRRQAILGVDLFRPRQLKLAVTREQSIHINTIRDSAIILSASGMATGGRILHHFAERLPDERNTVLFIGYQAEGTRGRTILEGRETVRMHGTEVPVRAKVERIDGFSGHADYAELLGWLMGFNRKPQRTFLVHGEPAAAAALAGRIEEQFGWDVSVPEEGSHVLLDF